MSIVIIAFYRPAYRRSAAGHQVLRCEQRIKRIPAGGGKRCGMPAACSLFGILQ
jgi:hypothetical protein